MTTPTAPQVDLTDPYLIEAAQKYAKEPALALDVVAIRAGLWRDPDRKQKARAIIQKARADMSRGAS
jgi:hypothetical protein